MFGFGVLRGVSFLELLVGVVTEYDLRFRGVLEKSEKNSVLESVLVASVALDWENEVCSWAVLVNVDTDELWFVVWLRNGVF